MRRRKPGPLSTGRDEVACQEVRPEARPGAHAELPLKLGARIDAQSTLRSNRLGTPGVSWLLRHSGSCRLRSRRRLKRKDEVQSVQSPHLAPGKPLDDSFPRGRRTVRRSYVRWRTEQRPAWC